MRTSPCLWDRTDVNIHLRPEGLCFAVPGPCLPDLKRLVQTDTQHIIYIYTGRSIGFLVGSILGGILLEAIKSKQAVMTICNFLMSSTMIFIPWCRQLGALAGFMVVNGMSLGVLNIGGNVLCIALWGCENAAFLQALHFAFGIGGLLAPLLAASFLDDYLDEDFSLNATNAMTATAAAKDAFEALDQSEYHAAMPNVVYIFSIIGGLGELVSLMFLAVWILSPTEEDEENVDCKNASKRRDGMSLVYLIVLLLLNFLLVCIESGTEIGYAQMITTYVMRSDQLQLSATTGAYMTSAFWAAFNLSRLVSIFLAIKVSNFSMILLDLIVSLVGSLVLVFLCHFEWAVWLASVLLGIGTASFYPSAVAWLGGYVRVTGRISTVFGLGSAFGEMLIPLVIGHFIDAVPEVLVYMVMSSGVFSTGLVFALYLLLRNRRKIVETERNEADDGPVVKSTTTVISPQSLSRPEMKA